MDKFLQGIRNSLRPMPVRMLGAAAGIFAIAILAYPRGVPQIDRRNPIIASNNIAPEKPIVPSRDTNVVTPLKPLTVSTHVAQPLADTIENLKPGLAKTFSLAETKFGSLTSTNPVTISAVSRKSSKFPKTPLGKEFRPAVGAPALVVPDSPESPVPAVVAAITPNPPMDMIAAMKDMEIGMKDMGMAETAPMGGGHIVLTSNSTYDNSDQVATLADLKRTLRNTNLVAQRAIEKSIKAREIRLPVFRSNF